MLRFLFPRLTADAKRGAELFAWLTGEARATHWYLAGKVPDSIDGRFAVLTTIAALAMVRLELEGESGDSASAALTERFVEAMEAEHRELGLGDPTLGRTVRKLVGALARRVELWRPAIAQNDWSEAIRGSVYGSVEPSQGALDHMATALRALWARLESSALAAIADGRIE
ncbi:MAG TPA: ubiquinol-cytochrome C chaperone family protein [Sphingomicrobium sp.]